ncbi:MAG: LysR family transcriptional regulator [Candidatus Brocadiia bacterium]
MTISNKIKVSVELRPFHKVWLQKGGEYAFGGGIAEILAAIRKTGSIKAAAESLDESYRYVWGRIQKTEEILGVKLIETTVGGQGSQRTQLTDFAQRILDPFLRFEANTRKQIEREFNRMMKLINTYQLK